MRGAVLVLATLLAGAGGNPPLWTLVPRGAHIDGSWQLGGDAIAVSFDQTVRKEAYQAFGVAIWQRDRVWRRVYFRRRAVTKRTDIAGLGGQAADVTGDGRPDLLLFQGGSGSGGCGIYRLLALINGRVHGLYVRHVCTDNTEVTLKHGSLVAYDGVVKDPKTRNGIHCCWTVWRRTVKRWQGTRLASVGVSYVRLPGGSNRP